MTIIISDRKRTARVLAAIALPCAGVLAAGAFMAEAQPQRQTQGQPAGQPTGQPGQPARGAPDLGGMLIKGLLATEGCLGADAAQLQSGKIAIIAWFENVAAAKRWYYSETHARVMNMAGSDPEAREPMQHVKDPDAPVMVIAAITMGGRAVVPGGMPISQISIEMYTPLPGGASVNGRLAPEAFNIPHFRRLDPSVPAPDSD